MPIDPRMSITTPVIDLLGINHPILLAPMDLVADGRLVATVDAAGGFGILGGGYSEEKWLVRELDLLDRSKARSAHEVIERVVHEASALLTRWSS